MQGWGTICWSMGGLLGPSSGGGYLTLTNYLPERSLAERMRLVNKACLSPQGRGESAFLPLRETLSSVTRCRLRSASRVWNLPCLCRSSCLTISTQSCAARFSMLCTNSACSRCPHVGTTVIKGRPCRAVHVTFPVGGRQLTCSNSRSGLAWRDVLNRTCLR